MNRITFFLTLVGVVLTTLSCNSKLGMPTASTNAPVAAQTEKCPEFEGQFCAPGYCTDFPTKLSQGCLEECKAFVENRGC